ncbi:MAG TPA: TolC family protein [Vicinamibacterales bacterium]|nr:TolC family protein [Vicinamibacterales bacterium]
MKHVFVLRLALLVTLCATTSPIPAAAQAAEALPSPLSLGDVMRIAGERRDEIPAARARTQAGEARPAIVSALNDPMMSPSLDHLPFMLGGADVSVTIEQQIPLSGIRRHRRASALADVDRLRAEAKRTTLNVGVEAANAYLMLHEQRRTAVLVDEQIAFARDVVNAANARYASGTAPQSDVLRAEVEVARLEALARALVSEVRGAEAMLNTSLALDADLPVPPLAPVVLNQPVPSWSGIKSALASRPELAAGRAEVVRAAADVQVMRDMFRPMATIRTGPSYTMAEGRGWMAMVGMSLPIWRGKLRAGVAEAQAMHAMSEADLRAMTRMIEGEAAVAVNQLQATRDRQSALTTDVLPRARMAIEPAVAGYASGQLPLVSVIEAVQALWFVQADLIAADTELGLAWARLGRAIGSYEAIVQ